MGVTREIEDAFVAHWSVFGRWPKGELRDEQGVLWFETPIRRRGGNHVSPTSPLLLGHPRFPRCGSAGPSPTPPIVKAGSAFEASS
jgi:hypothetical protein